MIMYLGISCAYAESGNKQPPDMGNFALPFSQQPGAFLSFGQNTLDKGQLQSYLFADDYVGNQQHFIDAMPQIVYGLSDNLSLSLTIPFAVNYRQASDHSSGLGDILLQLEYAYYSRETRSYSETATVVFDTTFPTGSDTKNPPTGIGAQRFL